MTQLEELPGLQTHLVTSACTDRRLLSPTWGCVPPSTPASCALRALGAPRGRASPLQAAAAAPCPQLFPQKLWWLRIQLPPSSAWSLHLAFSLCLLLYVETWCPRHGSWSLEVSCLNICSNHRAPSPCSDPLLPPPVSRASLYSPRCPDPQQRCSAQPCTSRTAPGRPVPLRTPPSGRDVYSEDRPGASPPKDQTYQHHRGAYHQCRISGPTPDLLHQARSLGDPGVC